MGRLHPYHLPIVHLVGRLCGLKVQKPGIYPHPSPVPRSQQQSCCRALSEDGAVTCVRSCWMDLSSVGATITTDSLPLRPDSGSV
eukprot:4738213-Amphidinium_carterae.2